LAKKKKSQRSLFCAIQAGIYGLKKHGRVMISEPERKQSFKIRYASK
jgi:hypothetical protein